MASAEKQGELEARSEGVKIALESFEEMRPIVQGLQIKASSGSFAEALTLLRTVNGA